MQNLEKKIVVFLNQHRIKRLDAFSNGLSSVPFLILVWFLIGIFLVFSDLFSGISICICLAIVFSLHFIVSEGLLKFGAKILSLERIRPYEAYPKEITPIGKKFSDSSFPSSHVSALVGGLAVLAYFYPFFWLLAIILTMAMGWSRIRNGMHYPSDVLAGIILGLLYAYMALMVFGNI